MATEEEMLLALIAVESGYMTQKQVQRCLDLQKTSTQGGERLSLMEIMVSKRYLTKKQVQMIRYQRVVTKGSEEGDECLIEGYHILQKRAQGGTATIFLARWQCYDCLVALKILHPKHSSTRMVKSFLNEARLLCHLDCAHIVKGYQYGRSHSMYFLSMEYIAGISVQSLIDKYRKLGETAALHIVLQIAKTLKYLDSKGIVHRDIKPANVLMDCTGHLILCDLGFARLINQKDYLQKEGMTCGTAAYLSPEQAMGERNLDIRSDIYALGVSLYQMLMGDVPFRGSQTEVIAQQVMRSFNTKTRDQMSAPVYSMLCKMMAKDKNLRYQNAAELISDIEKILQERGEARFDISSHLPADFAGSFPTAHDWADAALYQKLRGDQTLGKFRRTVGLKRMRKKR